VVRFVFQPLSDRAARLVRERRRSFVCRLCAVGRDRVFVRSRRHRGHWQALGFFDIKEHFISIGAALLPTYWVCWRRPRPDEPYRMRAALTGILAFIVWWGFLTGHVVNNIMGFGS
jgi:hypothetical protein